MMKVRSALEKHKGYSLRPSPSKCALLGVILFFLNASLSGAVENCEEKYAFLYDLAITLHQAGETPESDLMKAVLEDIQRLRAGLKPLHRNAWEPVRQRFGLGPFTNEAAPEEIERRGLFTQLGELLARWTPKLSGQDPKLAQSKDPKYKRLRESWETFLPANRVASRKDRLGALFFGPDDVLTDAQIKALRIIAQDDPSARLRAEAADRLIPMSFNRIRNAVEADVIPGYETTDQAALFSIAPFKNQEILRIAFARLSDGGNHKNFFSAMQKDRPIYLGLGSEHSAKIVIPYARLRLNALEKLKPDELSFYQVEALKHIAAWDPDARVAHQAASLVKAYEE